jgi:predicted Rossmann-fold nucleotide-binding protein
VDNFYQSFLTFLDHAADEGFIHQPNRDLVLVENNVEDMLKRLQQYVPSEAPVRI